MVISQVVLRELRFARYGVFLTVFGAAARFFFVRDARRACRGATCRTACWDFRVPFHAMVGVVVGV